jgi:hypothetical protein
VIVDSNNTPRTSDFAFDLPNSEMYLIFMPRMGVLWEQPNFFDLTVFLNATNYKSSE